jgi:adenylosuccinate lyase
MLALVDKGVEREEADEVAQKNALTAWEEETHYKKLLESDKQIRDNLTLKEIDNIFDYDFYLKEIDHIFSRVGLE